MTNELSTKVTNAIIKCFEKAGGDASELLRDLPYDRSYLTSPDNYVPAELQATLIRRAEKLLGDPDFAHKAGHYSARPGVLGPLSTIARLFASPEKLYEKSVSLAPAMNRLLSGELKKSEPGECVIELRASDAGKWSKEACKQTRGVLEAIPAVFGLPYAKVKEETCQMPIWRAGKIDGHYFGVGEDGTVTAYLDEQRTRPAREVGILDPDGSFVLGGVRYGAGACRYNISYKKRVGRLEKIIKKVAREKSAYKTYVEELERMNLELEKQFDEIQQRELLFRRLSEVGTAVVRQKSLEELMELVAWHTAEIAGAVVTRIFLINEDGSIRQAPGGKAEGDAKHSEFLRELVGDPNLWPENLDLSRHPDIEESIKKNRPTVFEKAAEFFEPFWPEEVCRRIDEEGKVQNLALVPLKSEEESLGFFFIVSTGEIETEPVQLLANMAAQAIANTRRLEEIVRQKERLEKLREIQMKTAMTRDVRSLHAYLVEKAREITGGLLVRLMFFEPGEKKIMDIHSSFDPAVRPAIKSLRRHYLTHRKEINVDDFLLWTRLCKTCEEGKVKKFRGVAGLMEGIWPEEFSRAADEELGIKETALVPLTRDDEIIGFMVFASSKTLDDDLLMMLSAQMSLLIKEAEYVRTIEEHRNRLDEKVRERTRQLEEANRQLKESQSIIVQQEKMASLGQLAAGVAHELNNPLGYIHSNLHSLKGYVKDLKAYMEQVKGLLETCFNSSDGAVREAASRLREAGEELGIEDLIEDIEPLTADCLEGAERAKEIVLNLKNFSRPGESRPSTVDLNAGVESTLSVVWNEIKYRAKVHKEYGDLPLINGYPQKLNQVIMNLLVNAAHSIEGNGDIWIRTRRNNGFVEVEVEDNGKGIKEEHLSRIFDPFFTTKPVGQGTGLGLSISYGIVKEHGGEILVESKPGRGSKFIVRLPEEGVGAKSAEKERETVQ